MTRERSPGGRRDLDQSKAQRTARPMVPGRSRSSKHVRIPPLSAAFPHGSARTKKQLVARGGSPHAPNVSPFDSDASAVAQEARFFATRKLSLHRRRLRRPSAPTVASEPRFQGGMDRCVGMASRCSCAPTIRARQACNERAAFATSRTTPMWRGVAPGLLALPRRSCSRPGVPRRSKLEGSRCRNRAFRTGTEHVAVRPDGRQERERGVA